MESDANTIKVGDFIVVQRQGYTKLHKLKPHGNLTLGNFLVEMDNIIGERYFDTFQMKNCPGRGRLYTLEKVEEVNSAVGLSIEKSGVDNRNITSDGQSQSLTKDEIDKLKSEELSSNTIVEQLITNSKTFTMKTEYSQEKYIKKKAKKYFEYIQIRRPSIRLLALMFYRQSPEKILGIRIDDLSQIITLANIDPDGNHLLYDSGSSGLMAASIMNAIGQQTKGCLIHMHPGSECQKTAFMAMQFPSEQTNRCINVNLYSVLRCFYQVKDGYNTNETEDVEPKAKKQKTDNDDDKQKKQPNWQIENMKACAVLKNKVDSLIITAKEHPMNIVKELLQFLNGGRLLVVFSLLKEPLQDLYVFLKSRVDMVYINISNNFMRNYQVLPNRTHPEVNMSSGGYMLAAYKLVC